MLICNSCETTFYEPKAMSEQHPYGESYATEYWSVCPNCESGDICEAEKCKQCDNFFAKLEDEGLCEICYYEMNERE